MKKEIIPDFIDIGLNVINPQFSCLDLNELRKITAHKICICTDIDRQFVLSFGTPEEIRSYIRKVCDIFADPAGGLVYHGEISGNIPLESVSAMLSAFYEFRNLTER